MWYLIARNGVIPLDLPALAKLYNVPKSALLNIGMNQTGTGTSSNFR